MKKSQTDGPAESAQADEAAQQAEAKRAAEVAELSKIPAAQRGESTNARLQELEVQRHQSLPKAAQ